MAIFGNLADMPLPDVLSMVGRGTGRFTVSNTSSQHYYERHLDKGMLTVLMVDNEPVHDLFELRNRMTELLNLNMGEFEFEKLASTLLLTHYNFSIEMLLLSALAALDEVAAYRPHLPDCQTIFQVQPNKEAWLEGDLLEFWQCSAHLLTNGASAEKIAETTSLFTDHVLLCLYKLRMTGIIAPVRAFQSETELVFQRSMPLPPSAATTGLTDPDPGDPVAVSNLEPKSDRHSDEMGMIQKIMLRLRRGFIGHA